MNRMLTAFALLVTGAGGMLLLAPGGLGDPRVERVTAGRSADGYRWLVEAVPEGLREPAGAGAGAGLLVLASLLGWHAWTAWRGDRPAVAGALLVGAATVVAYGLSEALKLVVDQERPCRALTDLAGCPPVGDWSFPSNHATIAGALAAGLVVLSPRLAVPAVPLAVTVALLRVVAGVHYPHDVAAGLLLGGTVGASLVVAATPAASRLLARAARSVAR
ncbi:phosphatase PAP2 family protein [Planosporangium sp. 12N6]|uniref:phosphatase PAP2 family protein n=1 Tax=Planosporangium spinosum TaxID=3402278 RepID=UPI003CE873F2